MSQKIDLASIRREYSGKDFNRKDLEPDPIKMFSKWFEEALSADVPEPNAMHLATTSANGRPSGRIVLLKGTDEEGFIFFTNYGSRKSREINENSFASLTFFWQSIYRQVRIEGVVSKISYDESLQYFQSRPRASQVGAWASNQSEITESRDSIIKAIENIENKFLGLEVLPLPDFWGGFKLKPDYMEFWQGRESRLHDRFAYEYFKKKWYIERLMP